MRKISISTELNPHFIGMWNINDNNLCKNIIKFFEENSELHRKGKAGDHVNDKVKKTTDITINPNNLFEKKYNIFNTYFEYLHKCFLDYREDFPYLKDFLKKITIGPFNLQKYLPGDHFSAIHCERTDLQSLHRIFAWMTYLNDVSETDGGSTDFNYYKVKVQPECGKTLIWPAEWTHAHAGSILKKGKKYIITGWINFKN
tara:strand:- start:182 stop:784 length:603 start_codon:yes stop_codon:yes gene_type:complete